MSLLRREGNRFFIALAFFTRIPIPASVGWSARELDRAARYFPLIGVLVGASLSAILWAALHAFPAAIAVLLTMIAGVLLTGAFHEDGLADSADGLGGGFDRERALRIMRDSRIGTYGALALMLALLLKLLCLVALAGASFTVAATALMLAHPLSRACAVAIMTHLPYVRIDEAARAKPVAENLQRSDVLVAVCTVIMLLLAVAASGALALPLLLALCASLLIATLTIRSYLHTRLGGYTGDALGATQQLTELLCYLLLVAWLLP